MALAAPLRVLVATATCALGLRGPWDGAAAPAAHPTAAGGGSDGTPGSPPQVLQAPGRPPFRVALIKFQRTGSSLLFDVLQEAACYGRSPECKLRWKPEIFWDICRGQNPKCGPETALQLVRRFSTCSGADSSCGWSLNLLRHGSLGLHIWDSIVKIISEQPMHVIFLTRENVAAQFLSYELGNARREVMRYPEFYQLPGKPLTCNAFRFSECSKAQREWVDRRVSMRVGPRRLEASIKEYASNNLVYRSVEAGLRAANVSNLDIQRLDYEDLFRGETWDTLFRAAGVEGAPRPPMHGLTDYSRFITNFDSVKQLTRAMGYEVALM
uniref:Sulfotransferase n=1 Tax=Alexandrium monilatum TaxID=311494 RepID=A0A7S4S635_9DINO